MGEGVEWALHVCTVLALLPEGTAMPATRLAEFHGVPAPYLAKQLQEFRLSRQVRPTADRADHEAGKHEAGVDAADGFPHIEHGDAGFVDAGDVLARGSEHRRDHVSDIDIPADGPGLNAAGISELVATHQFFGCDFQNVLDDRTLQQAFGGNPGTAP